MGKPQNWDFFQIKLKGDLKQFVLGMIKIKKDLSVDFSFIDKVIVNMVGIDKEQLHHVLSLKKIESPRKKNDTQEVNVDLPPVKDQDTVNALFSPKIQNEDDPRNESLEQFATFKNHSPKKSRSKSRNKGGSSIKGEVSMT